VFNSLNLFDINQNRVTSVRGLDAGARSNTIYKGWHKQGAYNPYVMRDFLQSRYPNAIITSNTVLKKGDRGFKHQGDRHEGSKVVYTERGFPDFTPHMVYEMQLPIHQFVGKGRTSHMTQATKQLAKDIFDGRIDPTKFSVQQLREISLGKSKISEVTWHHNERAGRMQLVKEKPHDAPHVGSIGLGKHKKSDL